MEKTSLPIDLVLPQLRQALAARDAVVLQAPPGAGKTTRVPLALLDASWLAGRGILMLEPRRLAASNAARYMAALLGEKVGERVGYTIRFERCVSPRTRIEVVTEGILTRRLQSDPALEDVGLVIFDEFHERNLHSDLALALCRDAQQGLREDLRLLVMSATLDAEPVSRLLGDAPLITSAGRSHTLDIQYLNKDPQGPVAEVTARAVQRALGETEGDILVFLPGVAEIRRCQGLLAQSLAAHQLELCPLYGELSFAEQERAILPGARRKVVLATNIAETSLTIEGVRVVVDSGLARQARFEAASGLTRLETGRISAASAKQRAGRAGRLGPGVCYRLWSPATQGSLLPFTPPEIRHADLAELALELARWGIVEVQSLSWLDSPPTGTLAGARALLRELGALDAGGRITAHGLALSDLGAHPRLANLMLRGRALGVPRLACDLAALLAERDVLRGLGQPSHAADSDFSARIAALLRRRDADQGVPIGVDEGALRSVKRAARYWRKRLGGGEDRESVSVDLLGRLLGAAYPDRIAQRRGAETDRYLLANGRGARLSRHSALQSPPFLVAVEIFGGQRSEGEIRLASRLTREIIEDEFAHRLVWRREVHWSEREERVVAREIQGLEALVLRERSVAPSAEEQSEALLEGVRRLGLDALGWTKESRQFLARLEFVARADAEGGWPEVSPEALLERLDTWLAPFLGACRSRADLARLDPLTAMHSLLDWSRRQRLERLAPTHLEVPSGSRIRLDYQADGPPVLAVKLQELFGLAQTPRLAGGRVPVLIHLLSPARRPLAVTQDLCSFWDNVYPEVKKELSGRYPRHPWPDDPWNATATRFTKRK
ncbi:ATP-dependent helicase HrpB [Geoalkalibacter ferrihydriticus]|uniref:ATP-dependent helicase n=2 Tax=Geoalkalibacter ferrihydriticus TaxID=392333 RepID=A0A0C2HUH5_9BACT|nr:ATP-dependent helicase HrpB [Geoalkalibacter ferrihydriticus]KIH76482.1 ATP-dependent helicase [Geoalkalibacter ferrihydriticus DSM 17813]SDL97607.1 ATP-dependent helicase HrpB [Geoalkalibacter ferrihydriticus]